MTWSTVFDLFGRDAYGLGNLHFDAWVPVFLEIGANIGHFTFDVCSRWTEARVAGFDPTPAGFTHLASNPDANFCAARVAVAAAVTGPSKPSLMSLFQRPSDGSSMATVEAVVPALACLPGHSPRRPAIWLDQIILGIGQGNDCVKLEVEAAKNGIVLGTRLDTVHQLRHLVVEYHPISARECAEVVDGFAPVGLAAMTWETRSGPCHGACWFTATQLEP